MSTKYEEIAHDLGFLVSPCGKIITDPEGKVIQCHQNRGGYLYFKAVLPIGRKFISVHRLQAYQQFGVSMYASGLEVRHLDGSRKNDAASNIAIGTKSENMMDKAPWLRSKQASQANLRHDHAAVRAHYAQSKSYKKTMAAFGISSKGTLSHIINKPIGQPDLGLAAA